MAKKTKTLLIVLASVALFCVIAFLASRYLIFDKIHSAILAQVDSLRSKGYQIDFDSLETSSLHNRITLNNLRIVFPRDVSACSDSANAVSFRRLEILGIEILPMILHKELKIKTVKADAPWYRHSKNRSGSTKRRKSKQKLKSIQLDHLIVKSAGMDLSDSGACQPMTKLTLDFDVAGVLIQDPGRETMQVSFDKAHAKNIQVKLPENFYTISLQQIEWDGLAKSIQVDSLKIKPDYDKELFAQKTGHQIDRIDCTFPSLRVSGAEIKLSEDPSFHVAVISLSFILEVFHDKRFPNAKPTIKDLPSRILHSCPLPIQIDTLHIFGSSVTYEEFPIGGHMAGVVSFDHLSAQIGNLSTRSTDPMKMMANARFMNASDLKADFTFPADPLKPYSVHGSVSNLNLSEINKILVPIANVKVNAGHLNKLNFDYTYNEYRSDGEITMNYSNLDVDVLKNGNDRDENKFLTFVAHAMVQKNMDQNKKQGKILFYHDPHHSTFNYWWKSILSGIKSLYNLDKISETHHNNKK
jgi:hypothetical protein